MIDIEVKLKAQINQLFDSGRIDLAVGYENADEPARTGVIFIDKKEQTDKLVWNSFCDNNIAVYLPRFFRPDLDKQKQEQCKKIGIIAKACTARSVNGLIAENQVPGEDIVVIGMPCTGMADRKKLERLFPDDEITRITENEETFEIATAGGEKAKIKKQDVLADACLECAHPAPEGADIIIEGSSRKPAAKKFVTAAEFEKKPIAERWEYFVQEFSKCIRCNACRQACPNCYCPECFIDQSKPGWAGKSDEPAEIMLYHIGRIFHQAGRCVECYACARACPMNIDLKLFTEKIVKDTEELFGYVPGLSREATLPLSTFKEDDNQDFITEP